MFLFIVDVNCTADAQLQKIVSTRGRSEFHSGRGLLSSKWLNQKLARNKTSKKPEPLQLDARAPPSQRVKVGLCLPDAAARAGHPRVLTLFRRHRRPDDLTWCWPDPPPRVARCRHADCPPPLFCQPRRYQGVHSRRGRARTAALFAAGR